MRTLAHKVGREVAKEQVQVRGQVRLVSVFDNTIAGSVQRACREVVQGTQTVRGDLGIAVGQVRHIDLVDIQLLARLGQVVGVVAHQAGQIATLLALAESIFLTGLLLGVKVDRWQNDVDVLVAQVVGNAVLLAGNVGRAVLVVVNVVLCLE